MDVQTMIEVVQAYIFHRKGKEVKIQRPTNVMQVMLLSQAYNTATQWFRDNNGSITFN